MEISTHVDAVWSAFCGSLPEDLQNEAGQLARRVGLVPIPDVPWSNIFKNEVTLGAPALLARAMPSVSHEHLMCSVTAHMLAIVNAFAIDRMLDRQAKSSADLSRLLDHVRTRRDRAMLELTCQETSPYLDVECSSLAAIHTERILLEHCRSLTFEDYAQLSLGKQAVAFPASLALASASGWDDRQVSAVKHALEGIVLGLQYHDDVVDWEDDWRDGRAWAVCLCRGVAGADCVSPHAAGHPELVRQQVHQSGVLVTMLNMSRRSFRRAAGLAAVLGANRLATWAREQERNMAKLAARETESAGYVVREHQLFNWAMEVLG